MTTIEDPIVQTVQGALRGERVGGICAFKGISYGAPTGSANRFRPPSKPQSWAGVRDAKSFGNGCWQTFTRAAPGTLAEEIHANFVDADDTWGLQGEDCLVLNVWTPEPNESRKRPVMVWLHGGSFTHGSGSMRLYDGTRLASRGDTVIVTVNHRLGIFGYLHLGDLDSRFEGSGNAGMLDLVAALEWVRDNIAAFGGDPSNVTIFGESGGGAKVCTLMATPAAKGLFHRAIAQSGACIRANEREDGTKLARLLFAELGLRENDIEGIQNVEPKALLKAATDAEARFGRSPFDGAFGLWMPVVDGHTLPHHPFDPDSETNSADVPLMIGTTKDETTLLLAGFPGFTSMSEEQVRLFLSSVFGAAVDGALELYKRRYPNELPCYLLSNIFTDALVARPASIIAERKARVGAAPVFLYVMTWETPIADGVLRSIHALDVPFMFDNVEFARSLVGTGPEPTKMAEIMSSTWLAFARSGDPNNSHIPRWAAFDPNRRTTMMLNCECVALDDHNDEVRAFWDLHR